ncbi:MAG: type VI secretion system baseplate subunit TssG [Acidobacteria bacterium]|nr:type VI secretion system baseplate subunit TssG [Acidobacteriota bacterium]MCB9398986.1 type VI secretion system baseplate subunit TssG [Acidobacteriota bacterium]
MVATLSHFFHALRRIQQSADREGVGIQYIQNPSRAFPSSFIDEVEPGSPLRIKVNFHGLLGNLGTLPDYFTDEILHSNEDHNGLQDFIEMFNHRMIENFFRAWRRYQILLENSVEAKTEQNQEFDTFLSAIGAQKHDDEGSELIWRCLRRHHLALFQRREKTFMGLQNILGSFFPNLTFEFQEHVEHWVRIPEHQRATLSSGLRIGMQGNFLVGTQARDISGKFNILIRALNFQTYMSFLPNGQHYKQLQQLLRLYVQNRWQVALFLELKREDVPALSMGQGILGASCWALSGQAQEDARVELGTIPL